MHIHNCPLNGKVPTHVSTHVNGVHILNWISVLQSWSKIRLGVDRSDNVFVLVSLQKNTHSGIWYKLSVM